MHVTCYLRIKASRTGYGDKTSESYFKATDLKISKNKPDTAKDEVAIKLSLDIPNSIFLKPQLEAKIKLEELSSDQEIPVQLVEELTETLYNKLGQKVHLTVGEEDE